MAIRGRRPKDEEQRVNRNALTHDRIDVPDVPYRGDRPGLPEGLPWQTREWWETVSTMPVCVLWRKEDWHFALGAALLHAAFVNGDMAAEPKLREREKVMGTTLAYRRDNRIRYVNPRAFEAPPDDDEEREAHDRMAEFQAERRRRILGEE
jgi:hypothetical protein